MVKIKFKRKQVKAKKLVFRNKKKHVKPIRRIVPRSVSIFSPVSFNKPVKRYWGDYDGDGVINGLDCEPRNKFKQGPQHKNKSSKKIYSGFDSDGEQLPDIKDPSTWPDMGGPMDYDFEEDEKLSAKDLKKKQDAYNQETWKQYTDEEREEQKKKKN